MIIFVSFFIRDITLGKPLPLEVTGIEYMNDDPAMVDVLYAKVNVKDASDKLVHQWKVKIFLNVTFYCLNWILL